MKLTPSPKFLEEIRVRGLRVLREDVISILYGPRSDKNSIWHKYNEHRHNSLKRKLPFELTIHQWWKIWEESGRWEQRGIGDPTKYVMARNNDSGGYTKGNVYITLCGQNTIDGHKFRAEKGIVSYKPKNLEKVRGYHATPNGKRFYVLFRGKNHGTYDTEQEAKLAYLSARDNYYFSVGVNHG